MKGGSSNDPYLFGENARIDNPFNNSGYQAIDGKALRSQTVNQSVRNLILFNYGCSNGAGVAPGAYTPINPGLVDNFNVYDGQIYEATNPLLSCNTSTLGPCNIMLPLASLFIQNNIFDRVILVPCCIGGSVVGHWSTGNIFYNKISAGMLRLKARGITPSTPGCTFAVVHVCGENDTGTPQADYQAAVAINTAKIKSDGFVGRIFVPLETLLGGVQNATVRAAQAALIDNVTYWSGGDLDILVGADRQGDNTHFSLSGQTTAAGVLYNAMHASGSPF